MSLLRTLIGLVVLVLLVGACNESETQASRIARLENAAEADTDLALVDSLLRAYEDYARAFPTEHERAGRYLYRAAALALRVQRPALSLELLENAIQDHYVCSNTSQAIALLGTIYREELRNPRVAAVIFQAGLKAFPDLETPDQWEDEAGGPLEDRIEELRENVYDPDARQVNYAVAGDYLQASKWYALILPDEAAAPDILFSAGELARAIQTYSEAIRYLQLVVERYPEHPRAPQALFLWGFTLDEGLQAFDSARTVYTRFVEAYPDDPFADDARYLLENLGRDPDELIRTFEQEEIE